MKQIFAFILIIVLSTVVSAVGKTGYENWIPADASVTGTTDTGDSLITTYDLLSTGEQLTLTVDTTAGEIRSLYGMCNDLSVSDPMDTETAESLFEKEYPEALIISSAEETTSAGTLRKLNILAENFYGSVFFDSYKLFGRDLNFVVCMQKGRLNMQGAVSVMKLLRPEASVSDIELDDDDGLLLYEGDAYVDGVEYEFELDAYTGRLLQWDRD